MTSTSSLITPPPEELLDKWEDKWHHYQGQYSYGMYMAEQAAQWGADQELEACYYWIENYHGTDAADSLQHARRPRPPTLNSIALQMLGTIERDAHYLPEITDTIRRALEALPND
jgi:hypothetical protein